MNEFQNNHHPLDDVLQASGKRRAPEQAELSMRCQLRQLKDGMDKTGTQSKENVIMNIFRTQKTFKTRWITAASFLLMVAVFAIGLTVTNPADNIAFANVLNQIQKISGLQLRVEIHQSAESNSSETDWLQLKTELGLSPLNPNIMIEKLKNLKDGSETELGEREIRGVRALGFELEKDGVDYTVWADAENGFPLEAEVIARVSADDFIKVSLTGFQKKGDIDLPDMKELKGQNGPGERSLMKTMIHQKGAENGKEIHLSFNSEMDEPPSEDNLIETLRLITELNDGVFPAQLDIPSVMDIFKAKHEGSMNQENLSELETLLKQVFPGLHFFNKRYQDDIHYEGSGVKLGDAEPVLWWKPADSETYRVIYGDLSIEDVHPDDFVQ